MPKITKRLVDAAEARSAEYFVWDSEIPGFGLRVLPSGRNLSTLDPRALPTRSAAMMTSAITTAPGPATTAGHGSTAACSTRPARPCAISSRSTCC